MPDGIARSSPPLLLRWARQEAAILANLPKSWRKPALIMVSDLSKNIQVAKETCLIERSPRFYQQIPEGIARPLFHYLVQDLLLATPMHPDHVHAAGHHLRPLTETSPRYGCHWLFSEDTFTRLHVLADALEEILKEQGITCPPPPCSPIYGDILPIDLQAKGKRYVFRCPHHDDRTPSAIVRDNGSCWCFACARTIGKVDQEGNYRPITGYTGNNQPRERIPGQSDDLMALLTGPASTGSHTSPATPSQGVLLLFFGSSSNAEKPATLSAGIGSPGEVPIRRPNERPVASRHENSLYGYSAYQHGLVLGKRYSDRPVTRYGKYGMNRSFSTKLDVLDLLRAAERRWRKTDETYERRLNFEAELYNQLDKSSPYTDRRALLPDQYYSLHWHKPTNFSYAFMHDCHINIPRSFEQTGGKWVGVDLDGFSDGPINNQTLKEIGPEIQQILEAHPDFSGRMGIVRTSERGVQMVFELAEVRWDLKAFYANPEVQQLLAQLQAMCLDFAHRAGFQGGHADPTANAAGRLFRRPGPRWTANGLYFSRLAYATP